MRFPGASNHQLSEGLSDGHIWTGAQASALTKRALARLPGLRRVMGNSLHSQVRVSIAAPGFGWGLAPDGTDRGGHLPDCAICPVAYKLHPETQALDNPFSRGLFLAFARLPVGPGGAAACPSARLS